LSETARKPYKLEDSFAMYDLVGSRDFLVQFKSSAQTPAMAAGGSGRRTQCKIYANRDFRYGADARPSRRVL